MADSMDA
jgi:hypothetical protein